MDDGISVYVPIGHDEPTRLDPVEASDDEAGIAGLLRQNPTEELICSPELARIAATHGLRVEDPPAIFEGMRVRLAMQYAQGDDFDQVTSTWANLFLMRSVAKLVDSHAAKRWSQRAFDVQLSGDRAERWAGWIAGGTEPMVTLVRSRADADELAQATADERAKRLSSLDHLAVRLVTPPAFARGPMDALYGAELMPWFAIRERGDVRMARDEDAFVIAGVFEALAAIRRVDDIGDVELDSPGRKVRTLVGAKLDAAGVD
ncbi:MAG: hypothetical protein AB7T06_37940 [Kofleriaceae bacterium]